MFCTECGTKIIEGAKFCYNCGAPVVPVPEETQAVQGPTVSQTAQGPQEAKVSQEPRESQPEPVQDVRHAPVSPETASVSYETVPFDKSIGEDVLEPQKTDIPGPAPAVQEAAEYVEGLTTGQLIIMILAGAAFLFATISINGANWPFRAVVLVACACLTFLAARKLELPRQIFALPLALFLFASFGDRIVTMIKRLMSHNTAGFSIEGISYRFALLIALVMLIFIVFSTSGKKKTPAAVFMVLCGLFALYHAYSFVSLIKYGRAVVMYNLGMIAFFAAYVLIAQRYLAGRAALDETIGNEPVHNQIHVESRADVFGTPKEQPKAAPSVQADSIYAPFRPQAEGGDIYCSRCGERIAADSDFCSKCGYPVR